MSASRAELTFLSAGLEITGRQGAEAFLRIMASTDSGQTRRIRLTEEQALRAIADLSAALLSLRRRGGA